MTKEPHVQTRRAGAGASAAVAAALAAAVDRAAAQQADAEKGHAGIDGPARVGLVGCGTQGRWLLTQVARVPGLAVKAVCDIWPARRARAADWLKGWSGAEPKAAADYRQILDDKAVSAVIVAVPDWLHAEIAVAALKAGKHVFCEAMMAPTIEGARSMVLAARAAKKVLHVGHQRRSNPLYKLAYEFLHLKETAAEKEKPCPHWGHVGRLTHIRAQFDRNGSGRASADPLEDFDCAKFGYESMTHLRDWRLYRKYGGGWMAELGSHQIDTINWMLDGPPAMVMGSAGLDHYAHETDAAGRPLPPREWFDSILTMFEYPDRAAGRGMIRVQHQIVTTNAYDEMHEQFMGDEGTLILRGDGGWVYREEAKISSARVEEEKKKAQGKTQLVAAVGRTLRGGGVLEVLKKREQGKRLEMKEMMDRGTLLTRPEHRYALEDFADCVLAGKKPPCTPEEAYAAAVVCIKAGEAAEKGIRIDFKPADFAV
jgi:predicted dehydrogenase